MNLKDFKVLSKAAYEALDAREQVKYEMQLEAYKEAQMKEKAEEAAGAIFEAKMAEMQKEREDELAALKKANDDALAEFATKNGVLKEDLEAMLKRAKIGEINERMKGFSDHITDKLSTPEGEEMIKSFFAGQREKFNLEIEGEALKAMGVPTGGVAPQFTPIVGPGHDEIHARSVIPVLPTTSNLIKFIQYVIDPEAAGFGTVAVGAQKPSLGYIPTVKEAPVRKIAGLLDVPDELLDDVVGFRAWIAYELPKAYLDAEDLQIFKGNGVGENLLGLWYQASLQTLPFGMSPNEVTSASNAIDKIVAGIFQVVTRKRNTTAVFISPVQYMEILINKSTEEVYTYPMVLDANGVMRIAGVPIFWSNVFTSGQGLVGDFARGTTIFQRKSMTIGYFDQNKDNVEKNMVTIRLEGRIALPIYYPEAFLRLFTAAT